MTDLYTKAVLTVIAGACVAIAVQNAMAPDPAYVPDPCGTHKNSPCYVVAAEEEGLAVVAADSAGLTVQTSADDFRVTVADWGVWGDIGVTVENWP